MSEAAAEPAPRPPVTLEELIERQNVLLERGNDLLELSAALLRPLGRRAGLPPEVQVALTGLDYRLGDYQGELRETREHREREVRLRTFEQMFERGAAQLEPAEPAPSPRRKGGHRRRDPASRRLRIAQGFAPAPALAWAAQHAAVLGTAGAATVTLGTALTLAGPAGHAASHARDLSGPVASAPQWTAVPVPSPSRSRSVQDADTAAPAPPYPFASAPVMTAAPPQPASAQPSPSQAPGVLVADTTVLNLGVLGAASVTLTAEGGPVQWSASPVAGLEAWPSSGTLAAGESVTVTFRATDQSHSGFGIVDLGGASVTVSWPAVAGLVQNLASSL